MVPWLLTSEPQIPVATTFTRTSRPTQRCEILRVSHVKEPGFWRMQVALVRDFSVDEAVIVNCSVWCGVSRWKEEMERVISRCTGAAAQHAFINFQHVELFATSFLTHS